jgi:hypothetical protein
MACQAQNPHCSNSSKRFISSDALLMRHLSRFISTGLIDNPPDPAAVAQATEGLQPPKARRPTMVIASTPRLR